MRYLVLMIVIIAGCASKPLARNCDEVCALRGMACKGETLGEESGDSSSPVAMMSGDFSKERTSSSSSHTYICEKDDSKAAHIATLQANLAKRDRIRNGICEKKLPDRQAMREQFNRTNRYTECDLSDEP